MTTFDTLRLDALVTSPTNPRKNFNPVKLQELADSIAASGVHQPILVRPLPGSRLQETFSIHGEKGLKPRPTHEIVAGERRYRASQLAKVATIPAMIRELTDDQVLEIQIIENLQRDDLTDLEAAEGYAALMKHNNLTAEQVGQKIGKSRTFVYNCLKLLDLHVDSAQALREGTIDASTALLIARIPDDKLQIKALEYATTETWNGNKPSVRDFKIWLHQNVMLPLDEAPFPIDVVTLVPAAGSCTDCTKRTGANPDLFNDVDSADICTDPPCYQLKTEAHHIKMIETAKAKGMRYIEGDEAGEICSRWNNLLEGYSPLSQERNDTIDGKKKTLRELLSNDMPAPILVKNPWTGVLTEAVPSDEVEAMLLARGLVVSLSNEAATGSVKQYEQDIAKLQADTARKIVKEARNRTQIALIEAVRAQTNTQLLATLTGDFLRAFLLQIVGSEGGRLLTDMFDIRVEDGKSAELDEACRLRIGACDTATLLKALIIFMLQDDMNNNYYYSSPDPALMFDALAKELKIDQAAIEKESAEDIEEVTKNQLKDLNKQIKALKAAQKSPAKTTSTPPPAGAAIDTGEADAKKPKPAASPAGASRKAKTTAQEAISGIAAAMQSIEAAPLGASLGGAEVAAGGDGALAVGVKVKVLDGKHADKAGVIKTEVGGDMWSVEIGNMFSVYLPTKSLQVIT